MVSEPTPTTSLASGVNPGSAEAGVTPKATDATTAVVTATPVPRRRFNMLSPDQDGAGGWVVVMSGTPWGSQQVRQQAHGRLRGEPGEGQGHRSGPDPDECR